MASAKLILNPSGIPKGFKLVSELLRHPSDGQYGALLRHATTGMYVFHAAGENRSASQKWASKNDNEKESVKMTTENKAAEMLEKAILAGELNYYRQTGSTAYVAEYADGERQIVFNSLSAKEARPGIEFKLVAAAHFADHQGNPGWTIRDEEMEVLAVILDGDSEAFYY